ncbi:MAG: DUF721 domain-containing protein [Sporomusaceae bacterium]|nr:DUF721 domain-containing protein [Sporomusaceae bacterium]
MFSAKDILPSTLKSLGMKRQFAAHTVILHWQDIAGAEIAMQSQPTAAKNGILFVAVKTPVWGHHLSMLKEQLLAKIEAFLGQKLFTDMKFHAGNFVHSENSKENGLDFREKLATVILSSEQRMEVKKTVYAVNDGALRYRLQRLMLKDKKRRKLLEAAGWHSCLRCSSLCPSGEQFCTSCASDNSRRRREEIRRLLTDAPWVGYAEANSCITCSREEYNRCRQEVMQSLVNKIDVNHPDPIDLSTLAMLVYETVPDRLDQETLEKTLRFIRRNRYVFTSGR